MSDRTTRLRLILGDQLNHQHSWFSSVDDDTVYVMAELRSETDYVRHHVQKVCAFFAAMRAFAAELSARGHRVQYLTLDDTPRDSDVPTLLKRLVKEHEAGGVEYQRPDEYRLLDQLRGLRITGVTITESDTEHFLVPFPELPGYFTTGKASRMESFYRKLRVRFGVLVEDGKPEGGQWNYDASNRKKLKPADLAEVPAPLIFPNDVSDILAMLERHQVSTIGLAKQALTLPVDRQQSLQLLDFFCKALLPRFGDFQDAMTQQSDYDWSLYHSRLSFSLNAKLLHPMEVIEAAIAAFEAGDDIDISQVEGFVRQVLGWREFIRGIYWANMPAYAQANELDASRTLPGYFWTGDTRMNCVSKVVLQSLEHAYAHHIQRLMVTGVFTLLAGINPDEVDDWYLGIYHDALEWVEMPNTRGMSQFADGGLVASKPYAASGNYIHKMSDYCNHCSYKVKEKTGDDACPFNALYWDFMVRHRSRFERNPRIGMIYRNWDRQDPASQQQVLEKASDTLANLAAL